MPLPTLSQAIRDLAPEQELEKGRVVSVTGDGVLVQVATGLVRGEAATDEPFRAGQQVWCQRIENGRCVVFGSAR
jgi:hypothetical protein